MQKSKLKFFWDNMLGSTGSLLVAPSTSSTADHKIEYMTNWLETNSWKESTGGTTARTFTYDAGVGNAYPADYLAIYGHNLNGSTIVVTASSDNFAASTIAVDSFVAGTTAALLSTFTRTTSYRYWHITISGATATQQNIQIMSLGTKTELDYIRPAFDPYQQEIKANVNMTQGGYVSGIHERYTERMLAIDLSNETTVVYASVKTWFETHGAQNFIVAWDSTGSSADVWLMRNDLRFSNPINQNKFRDISIKLMGRKL